MLATQLVSLDLPWQALSNGILSIPQFPVFCVPPPKYGKPPSYPSCSGFLFLFYRTTHSLYHTIFCQVLVAKAVHELPMSIERLHFYGTSACCQKYEKNTTMCKLIVCICSNFQTIYCLISCRVKIK